MDTAWMKPSFWIRKAVATLPMYQAPLVGRFVLEMGLEGEGQGLGVLAGLGMWYVSPLGGFCQVLSSSFVYSQASFPRGFWL